MRLVADEDIFRTGGHHLTSEGRDFSPLYRTLRSLPSDVTINNLQEIAMPSSARPSAPWAMFSTRVTTQERPWQTCTEMQSSRHQAERRVHGRDMRLHTMRVRNNVCDQGIESYRCTTNYVCVYGRFLRGSTLTSKPNGSALLDRATYLGFISPMCSSCSAQESIMCIGGGCAVASRPLRALYAPLSILRQFVLFNGLE